MNSETSNGLHVVDRPVTSLVNFSNNARTHSKRQIRQIADSIRHQADCNASRCHS
jgi:hypothetical protein